MKKMVLALLTVGFGMMLWAQAGAEAGRSAASAPAAEATAEGLTGQQLADILKKKDIVTELTTLKSGAPLLNLTLADMKAQIYFFDKSEDLYGAIQLHACFKGPKDRAAALRKINEWNKTKRYARAYIDSDNDYHLETDLDLSDGVNEKAIVTFVKRYRASMMGFVSMGTPEE